MAGVDPYIHIPKELEQYKINTDTPDCSINIKTADFGVKIVKNNQGELEYAAYYSDSGELIKRIYYKNSEVSKVIHYRNNIIYSEETYHDGCILKKIKYDKDGNPLSHTNFQYNKLKQLNTIKKFVNSNIYEIQYGYDELKRLNSRKIFVNSKEVNNQIYEYDILDRIVEYKDSNQKISIKKMNQNNQLISYIITDKVGNDINILNKFYCSEYIGTEVELNGHKTTVKDKNYLDNILLRKPCANEDDLDFSISSMSSCISEKTHRESKTDVIDIFAARLGASKENVLPISIRKKMLLMNTA